MAPDVVLLDIDLPDIDGWEVCRQLRTFSDAYVVMLTVHADEFDRVLGLSSGADDYITKPFAPRELVAASGRCSVARGGAVERARRRRRTPP